MARTRMRMMRWVVVICGCTLLSGCLRRYEYDVDLQHVFDAIGPGLSDRVVEEARIRSTVPAGVAVQAEVEAKGVEERPTAPSVWPYVLFNGRRVGDTLIWDVRRDVSGLYMQSGRMLVRRSGDAVVVDAPGAITDEFVEWYLERASADSPRAAGTE